MVPQLSQPRQVFLCAAPGSGCTVRKTPQLELVESSSSLKDVMALLHTKGLTCK